MDLKKIRILHINNVLGFGGAEKIVYQLCSTTKDDFEYVAAASMGGTFADRLTEQGIDHFTIPDLSSKNPKDICSIISILKSIIRDKKINIIHCHHRMAVVYAKLLKHSGMIIVYNNHTIYSDKALFSRYVLSNLNIVADGVQAKKNLTDFFKVRNSSITVINNAVNPFDGVIEPIDEISRARENGKFVVINAARLHPQKGMQYFIDAASILIDKGCNIAFFIIGEGELKNELKNQVTHLNLDDRITFLGFQKNIKSVLSQGDVTVLTSIYEGLPLTPMESFSVSKPVIATDIDGTREVVHDGINGLLATSRDPKSIADKIFSLYSDRALLEKLGRNALLSFENEFSLKPFQAAYIEFYKSL